MYKNGQKVEAIRKNGFNIIKIIKNGSVAFLVGGTFTLDKSKLDSKDPLN